LLVRAAVYIIISLLILNKGITHAQESDSSDAKGVSWLPIPFAFYTPETKLALGAMVIASFRLSEHVNSGSN